MLKMKKVIVVLVLIFVSLNIALACEKWDECNDDSAKKDYLLNKETLDDSDLERARDLLSAQYDDTLAEKYLEKMTNLDNKDMSIAEKFYKNQNNIAKAMSNPKLKNNFQSYYNKKTGSTIQLNGDLSDYNPPSFTPKGGKQFKNFQDIPTGSFITVNGDGSVSVCKSGTNCDESEVRLFGNVEYNNQFDSYNVDGEVNGNQVGNGKNLKFDDNGNILSGTAETFETKKGKVSFRSQQSLRYNKETDTIMLNNVPNGVIRSIEGDLNLEGSNIVLPNGNRINQGKLKFTKGVPSKVGESSDVLVDGFNHKTQNKYLLLKRIESLKFKELLKDEKIQKEPFLKEIDKINKNLIPQKKIQKELLKKMDDIRYKIDDAREKNLDTNALWDEYDKIDEKYEDLNSQIRLEEKNLLSVLMPFEKIGRNFEKRKNDLFEKEIASLKTGICKNKNCFASADDRVFLTGSDYKTQIKENNKIFPGVVDFNSKKANLAFDMNYGSIKVKRNSGINTPLALGVEGEGNFDVLNGNWKLSADRNKIYGKIENNAPMSAYDIRFIYQTDDDGKKLYDFDIDTSYKIPLSSTDLDLLSDEHKIIQKKMSSQQKNLDTYMINSNSKSSLEEIEKYEDEIDELNKKYDYLYHNRINQIRRDNPVNREAMIEEVKKELDKIDIKISDIYDKKEILEKNPEIQKMKEMEAEIEYLEMDARKIKSQLKSKTSSEIWDKGVFGEVKVSNIQTISAGKTRLNYEDWIQGFPIVKNTYIRQFDQARRASDNNFYMTGSGERLEVPQIAADNHDILDLASVLGASNDVIPTQQCIHTQYRLRFEYLSRTRLNEDGTIDAKNIDFSMADGTNINLEKWRKGEYKDKYFKNSKIPIQSKSTGTSDLQYINRVMGFFGGVKYHTRKNDNDPTGNEINPTSPLVKEHFDIVQDYDNIKPGDVIIGGTGHGLAVKEVMEVEHPPGSGNRKKYVKIFSGSEPAIDPFIDKTVYSVDYFKSRSKIWNDHYPVTGVLRWKN